MQYNIDNKVHLFNIYKIKGDDGKWNPGIEDVADHEIDPLWAAAVMFSVYNKYINAIPEQNQIEFEAQVKGILENLFETGANYIDQV